MYTGTVQQQIQIAAFCIIKRMAGSADSAPAGFDQILSAYRTDQTHEHSIAQIKKIILTGPGMYTEKGDDRYECRTGNDENDFHLRTQPP